MIRITDDRVKEILGQIHAWSDTAIIHVVALEKICTELLERRAKDKDLQLASSKARYCLTCMRDWNDSNPEVQR